MTFEEIRELQKRDIGGGARVRVVDAVYLAGRGYLSDRCVGCLQNHIGEVVCHNANGSVKVMFNAADVAFVAPGNSIVLVDLPRGCIERMELST